MPSHHPRFPQAQPLFEPKHFVLVGTGQKSGSTIREPFNLHFYATGPSAIFCIGRSRKIHELHHCAITSMHRVSLFPAMSRPESHEFNRQRDCMYMHLGIEYMRTCRSLGGAAAASTLYLSGQLRRTSTLNEIPGFD